MTSRILQVILTEETQKRKLGDFCEIKVKFPDADFWIKRRGDLSTVGKPTKEFNQEDIGIKVTDLNKLDPRYLYYVMQHLHGQGYFKKKSRGILQLVHITVNDVQNIPVSIETDISESQSCPQCGGEMVSEEVINEKKDACYYKVKSRYKVWPSAYACVPEESSKALTRTGWKSVNELSIGDEIMTYNMHQDILEFKPILNLHRYSNVQTNVVQSGNSGFLFECTPNHKWVVKLLPQTSNKKSKYEKINNMTLLETSEMIEVKSNKHLVVSAPYNDRNSLKKENIFENGENWIEYILDITPEQRQSWIFSAIVDSSQAKTNRLTESNNQTSDLNWFFDGNHGKQVFEYKQKDIEHRDAFLLASFLNGGTVTWKNHYSKDIYSCYYISNKRYQNLSNFKIVGSNTTNVWCPETENSTWVMMQSTNGDGIITITGNSGALVKCRKKGAANWGKSKKKVSEAPISDYELVGFDKNPKRFRDVDKRLVQHPLTKVKTEKFFSKVPYNFRLFFYAKPGFRKYTESGEISVENVHKNFGDDALKILDNSSDSITIIFLGNSGAEKVMMTPWVMAHRVGHTLQWNPTWKDVDDFFWKTVNEILNTDYGIATSVGKASIDWSKNNIYSALFNSIGTQRSSRKKLIKRSREFLYELFAQYIKDGKITLNPLPSRLSYGKKAWGRPTNLRFLNASSMPYRQEVVDELAETLEQYFSTVLDDAVGKIFLM